MTSEGIVNSEPETSYRLGQDNVQFLGLDVHNPVFVISAISTTLFVFFTILFQEQAASYFGALRIWLTTRFDWFFLLSTNIFVLVSAYLIVTPLGKIKTGRQGGYIGDR